MMKEECPYCGKSIPKKEVKEVNQEPDKKFVTQCSLCGQKGHGAWQCHRMPKYRRIKEDE